jgi:hypothetical protein
VQYNNAGALAGDADMVWDATNNVLTLGASAPAVASAHELVAGTTPATPSASRGRLFARTSASRVLPRFVGPSGVDHVLQASIWGSLVTRWHTQTGTTMGLFGKGSTNAGTLSHPALANTNFLTAMRRVRFASSAGAGSFAGARGVETMVWRGNAAGLGGFFFACRFAMATNLANARAFVGLNGATGALTTDLCGMSLDSADANWQVITNDNGGAATKTNLGASFVKSTTAVFDLRMFCAPNGSDIFWEASIPATGTASSGTFLNTNLPRNTVFLNPYIWITNNATASSAQIEMAHLYLESDT